jgi:FkbM family methyltransferase
MKRKIVRLAERTFNCRIYRKLPHGIEVFTDIARTLPGYLIQTIFDVGANVGQTARVLTRECPEAQVFCFEPVASTFGRLRERMAANPNVRCFPIAFGAEAETREIRVRPLSPNNSLSSDSDVAVADATVLETVRVDTLDRFTAAHGVERIDFLKIDTEGFDLEVLRGAEGLLRSRRIALLQVEASMNRQNTKHVPLAAFVDHLEDRGYALFGLYEQTPEWSGEPRLRFCNPVFVADPLPAS